MVWLLGLAMPLNAGEAEQKLIEACYRLDIDPIKELLASGANPNEKYGKYDKEIFSDPWTLGFSLEGSENWTALLALVHASEVPPPSRKVGNTVEDRIWASNEAAKIPEKVRAERRRLKLRIAQLLIDAGAALNADDGYGATALYRSAGDETGIALLLIEKGAKVNTRTGIYIDGPGDKTPLHRAIRHPDNLAALIQAGAALDAQDSHGSTALHGAVRVKSIASVKLLLDAGAKTGIRDKEGRVPADSIVEMDSMPAEERLILKLLKAAGSKRSAGK